MSDEPIMGLRHARCPELAMRLKRARRPELAVGLRHATPLEWAIGLERTRLPELTMDDSSIFLYMKAFEKLVRVVSPLFILSFCCIYINQISKGNQ